MIPIKSERDLRVMRKSCEIAATVLDKISKLAVAGLKRSRQTADGSIPLPQRCV